MDKVRALEEEIQKLKEKRKHIQTCTIPLSSTKILKRLNQQITKAEEQRYRRIHKLEIQKCKSRWISCLKAFLF